MKPPPLSLCANGTLGSEESTPGTRQLIAFGQGLNRQAASVADPASHLIWTSAPLEHDLDVIGDAEIELDAGCTAPDTAWIALLQDVDPSGNATDVTAGFLRASLREVDEQESRTGSPVLPCTRFEAVPVGTTVRYRIPLVVTARRFRAGHRVQLLLTSDDQNPDMPAMLNFRHASVGTNTVNTIASSSRLLLPVVG